MCEAGSPSAFYKHGGGVEFGATKQKKKIYIYVPTIAQNET